jgi:hypothetical protein
VSVCWQSLLSLRFGEQVANFVLHFDRAILLDTPEHPQQIRRGSDQAGIGVGLIRIRIDNGLRHLEPDIPNMLRGVDLPRAYESQVSLSALR